MRKYLLVFALLLTLFPSLLKAQLESAHWYFGYNMGLDFTSGSPVLDFSGKLHTQEGCASLSDNAGNLLFYTDGRTVYDKTHSIMPNGDGLYGSNSSSQSGFIIPNAYNKNLYYIFTVDANDFHTDKIRGLHYSVVDMTLNSGRGGVIPTQKNIPLPLAGAQKSSEKITAVRHINGRDVWMITHFLDSFYAFLISKDGVSTTPVISTVGDYIPYEIEGVNVYSSNGRGYIKTSPNGKKIAIAHLSALQKEDIPELPTADYKSDCAAIYTSGGVLGLYDFNNATGIISNETILSPDTTEGRKAFYGIEFSPNSKVLYAEYDMFKGNLETCSYDGTPIRKNWLGGKLVQFDLTAANIPDSEFLIHPFLKEDYPNRYELTKGALQSALDKKIYYVNGTNYHRISVINNPNTLGLGANFDRDAIRWDDQKLPNGDLLPYMSQYGLPPFIVHFFEGDILFNGSLTADDFCVDNEIEFSVKNDTESLYTIDWDFGDGSPIEINKPTPSHSFSAAGTYIVTATINYDKESVELERSITILPPPVIALGEDFNICEGEPVELDSGHLPTETTIILWTLPDGTTQSAVQKLEAKQSGKYIVEVTKDGCTATAEINVTFSPLPIVDLGEDRNACEGDIVELDSGHLPTEITAILWTLPDGTTQSGVQKIEAKQSGKYSVKVTKDGCSTTAEINVTIYPLPIVDLGADRNACEGDIVELDSGHLPTEITAILWTLPDGTTQSGVQKIEAKTSGKYTVKVTKNECSTTAEINVTFSPLPIVDLGEDRNVCETEPVELDSGHLPTETTVILWTLPDGTTQSGLQKLEAKLSGKYTVSVTKDGCTVTDNINVRIFPLPIVNLGEDINTCDDSAELDSGYLPAYATIVWTLPDGTTQLGIQKLVVKQSGNYTVSISKDGCFVTDDINVTFLPRPIVDLGEDINTCDDTAVLDSGHLPTKTTVILWTLPDGTTQRGTQTLEAKQSGTYIVSITQNTCTIKDEINVALSLIPYVVEVRTDGNSAEIISKGNRPLEYSLDAIHWQNSPLFTNLEFGVHKAYVKNAYGCISEPFDFGLLNIPNIITPNGDGKNDAWHLKGLELYPGSKIQIFDRYGKILVNTVFTQNPVWDGKYLNNSVASATYWYIIELTDGRKLNGAITVKNY